MNAIERTLGVNFYFQLAELGCDKIDEQETYDFVKVAEKVALFIPITILGVIETYVRLILTAPLAAVILPFTVIVYVPSLIGASCFHFETCQKVVDLFNNCFRFIAIVFGVLDLCEDGPRQIISLKDLVKASAVSGVSLDWLSEKATQTGVVIDAHEALQTASDLARAEFDQLAGESKVDITDVELAGRVYELLAGVAAELEEEASIALSESEIALQAAEDLAIRIVQVITSEQASSTQAEPLVIGASV